MRDVFFISACRTPVGAFGGSLAGYSAAELGAIVIKEALNRAGLLLSSVDEVVMGNVCQTDPRGNPAREAALAAGLPVESTAYTVNKNCGSGAKAIALGCQMIAWGEAQVVVAGGMESMSRVPFLLRDFRWGHRMGHASVTDLLTDLLEGMGLTAEELSKRYGISRQEQDEFAWISHVKASTAWENGIFMEEIVPVEAKPLGKRGQAGTLQRDESVRPDTSLEKLAALKPVFLEGGTVTAGNSCPINDGAAAVVLASGEVVERLNLKPMARFVGWGAGGVAPEVMGLGPVPATRRALQRTGLSLEQIDLIELNEAFAAQALAVIKELGLPTDRVNVNGGAIALGHPVGATGAILVVKLIYELKRRKQRYGLATMCIGGGQGITVILENLISS